MVPLGPFQDWLIQKVEEYGSQRELEDVTKMPARRLYACINGFETVQGSKTKTGRPERRTKLTVSEDVVDRVLVNEGSTFLWELYPELYKWTPEEWDEFNAEMAALEAQDVQTLTARAAKEAMAA